MYKQIMPLLAVAGLIVGVSCGEVKAPDDDATATQQESQPAPEPPKVLHTSYQVWRFDDNDSLRKVFKKQFTPAQLHLIWGINRIDGTHFSNVDTLLIPDTFSGNPLAYAPFPFKVSILNPVEKIALFAYPIQAYALYEHGYLVKWGPTSMGSKQHPTPTGLFFTNWKGEEVQSTFDDEWILRWNFNIENKEGVGWHQYALPGYPASHSCLRLLEEDARWMYNWAEEWILKNEETELAKGTPVIVFGQYAFGSRKPWLALAEDMHALDMPEASITAEVRPFMDELLQQQQRRHEVEVNQAGKEQPAP